MVIHLAHGQYLYAIAMGYNRSNRVINKEVSQIVEQQEAVTCPLIDVDKNPGIKVPSFAVMWTKSRMI